MSEHERINDWLPVYAAGGLEEDQRRQTAAHLAECEECRADLWLWQNVGTELRAEDQGVRPPSNLAGMVLAQARIERAQHNNWQPRRIGQLLKMQAPLVQKELWPASAVVIAIGYFMTIQANNTSMLQTLAPLAAAAGVAALFRPEDDAAMELALSTPTSPRQILLARLTLVFGYNLILALLASLGLVAFFPAVSLAQLILGWLAPMAFLSMAALALSLVVGHDNAILASYSAWLLQYLPNGVKGTPLNRLPGVLGLIMDGYSQMWRQPGLLLALAAAALMIALWLVGAPGRRLPQGGGQRDLLGD